MKRKYSMEWYCAAVLIILSILAAISKILVGFDIDEGYAVVMPYRLLQGDTFLKDMWEVHFTSSILPAIIIKIIVSITGSINYLVLNLRILSTILHLIFSIWVYSFIRKEKGKKAAILTALLYFNFLPKWLINFDFSMQLIWGMTAMLLLFYEALWHNEVIFKKNVLIFLAGIVLAMTVLGYPTTALLYPVGVWPLIKKDNKKKAQGILWFTLGCTVMALFFLGYLLSYMKPNEIIESIPFVFSDGSHQFDMQTKWALFLQRWVEAAVQAVILIVPAFVVTISLRHCGKVSKKWNNLKAVSFCNNNFLLCFTFIFIILSSGIVIFANLFGIDWGPFRLQVRYLIMFILAFCLAYKERKKSGRIVQYLLIPALISFLGILFATNVGPVSSSSYLVHGMAALLLLLFLAEPDYSTSYGHVVFTVCSLFILSLIFCKGYYIRVSEYPPANILEKRTCIEEGPAAGIYVYEKDAKRFNAYADAINKNTDSSSRLLFLGTEQIANMYSNGTFVTPTTISTPAFNEQWVLYFKKHPDKLPDVVAIAKNTIDNREKFFAKNPFGIWLAERYDTKSMWEDEEICIIKRK